MVQLTAVDLSPFADSYESTRDVGDVLIGDDIARPVIEASSSGNNTALQSLLSQPKYRKIMLESPHCIYQIETQEDDPNPVRRVAAMPMSNVERALTVAAENGQAAVVPTLLGFAKQQGIEDSDVITRAIITKIIKAEQVAVLKALASARPHIINFEISHGALPLYDAVRTGKTDLAIALLELGADPSPPPSKKSGTYNQSLMSLGAKAEDSRLIENLLKHGHKIPGTAALHSAATCGHLDTMRLLIQHGADVNEALGSGWSCRTPMHFAASWGEIDAMKLLEENGARSDVKDSKGRTPTEVLEQFNATKR